MRAPSGHGTNPTIAGSLDILINNLPTPHVALDAESAVRPVRAGDTPTGVPAILQEYKPS